MSGFGSQEELLGEMGSGDLQANFGDFSGAVFAQKVHEIVLVQPKFHRVILRQAPFPVAAADSGGTQQG